MEYIDEVDENNNLTNRIFSKEEFHNSPKWYREVMCFAVNSNGEILIQKRSKRKKDKPLYWEVCTGHVSSKETPEIAMQRELKEELGIETNKKDLKKICILKTKDNMEDRFHYVFTYVFMIKINVQIENLIMQEDEVDQIKFIKIPDLLNMLKDSNIPNCLLVYEKIADVIKNVEKLL